MNKNSNIHTIATSVSLVNSTLKNIDMKNAKNSVISGTIKQNPIENINSFLKSLFLVIFIIFRI